MPIYAHSKRDLIYLADYYMTASEAAIRWNCSYSSAYRYFIKHPEHVKLIRRVVPGMRPRTYPVISRLTPMPSFEVGNPRMKDSAWQSAQAYKRIR